MLTSLTLPALILVGGISGVPGLNWLKGFKLRHPPAPAADTLPPLWKTPSRLALENQLVRMTLAPLHRGPVGLDVKADTRRLRVGLQPDSGFVSAEPQLGDVALEGSTLLSLRQYAGDLTQRTFRQQMVNRT